MGFIGDTAQRVRRLIPVTALPGLARRRVDALWANEAFRTSQEAEMQFLLEHTDRAAEIPLRIARAASDVSELAALVAEEGQPSLRVDAATAALLAEAGARAAAAIVEVNLTTTADDERVAVARQLADASGSAAERALASVS